MGFAESTSGATPRALRARDSNLSKESQYIIGTLLAISVFAIFYTFGLHGMTDSKYSMVVSEDLLRHQSFAFDERSMPRREPFALPEVRTNGYPYQIELHNGKVLYFYPVGSSVLSLPFVALMNSTGISAHAPDGSYNEPGEVSIQRVVAAFLMGILTAVFFRTAMLLLPLSWSIVLALGAAFSTQIWSTASRVLWSHTWQILLLGIAAYILLSQEKWEARGRPFVLATILSWAYFVRPTSSIPTAAISGYILIYRRQEFIAYAITVASWMVAFVAYSLKLSGQVLPSYYLFHLTPKHVWVALPGELISPSRGLFIYVPAAAFALMLVGYYWRQLSHRRLVVVSLIIITIHVFAISTDPNWWGGHCFGARLATDVIPWLFLLAVLGSRCLLDEPSSKMRHLAMTVGLLTLVIGAFINGRGAISPATSDWVNGPPDVDRSPRRVWDWSNPQFLAGLQLINRSR